MDAVGAESDQVAMRGRLSAQTASGSIQHDARPRSIKQRAHVIIRPGDLQTVLGGKLLQQLADARHSLPSRRCRSYRWYEQIRDEPQGSEGRAARWQAAAGRTVSRAQTELAQHFSAECSRNVRLKIFDFALISKSRARRRPVRPNKTSRLCARLRRTERTNSRAERCAG